MRFLIISHVRHKRDGSCIGGYGPYIREMNLWSKHVDEVRVIAPIQNAKLDEIDLPHAHPNIEFVSVPAFELTSLKTALKALFSLPLILLRIFQCMSWANHLHLRCPGNMGLLGCFVQILFPKKKKTAKYAGNWDRASKQPWSYRLQQRILSNTFLTHNMQALVYGEWPNKTQNIKPFFTATYHAADIQPLKTRSFSDGIKLVFVGSLTKGKQPLLAVQAAEALMKKGHAVSLDLLGEGAERNALETYTSENKLHQNIRLLGNVSADTVKEKLQQSHFLIFISKSEGWPKVVAESMFWGCVPITTRVSCVPYMLDEGKRGALIEPTVDSAVKAVESYLNHPEIYQQHSRAASEWSRQFTLEKFETEIVKLLQVCA
jgi:glycosyltransferase involved in cell wall biosynthesis